MPIESTLSAIIPSLPQKQIGDAMIAASWESSVLNKPDRPFDDTLERISPWLLYEVGLKTNFRAPGNVVRRDLRAAIESTQSCDGCHSAVLNLIERRAPTSEEQLFSRRRCYVEWKEDMRRKYPVEKIIWPQFDYTVLAVKPNFNDYRGVIEEQLENAGLITLGSYRRTLTPDDVAYLYSTVFGTDFIRRHIKYYTGEASTFYLIQGDDIVNRQATLKRELRAKLPLMKGFRANGIHLPDSLAETFSNIYYFFDERTLVELIETQNAVTK